MSQITLTAVYTPPPSCTLDIYTSGIYYSIGGPSPSICFPSGWESTSQYFSPGLCPTGYTQACVSAVTAGKVTESQATCCPTGYECYTAAVFNFPGQACASLILSETTTTVTNASNNKPMLATFHPQTEAVNGYGVSIRYQSTDFISSTSSSSTPSSTSFSPTSRLSTVSSTTSVSPSALPVSATTAASVGLSTGAKVGIGIGAAVCGLAVLAGIAILFLTRRRNAHSAAGLTQEIDGHGIPQRYGALGEMSMAQKKAHEINTSPAELGGGDVRR